MIEINLNSFVYRFRRLTWVEEASCPIPPGADAREVFLALALTDVSGYVIQSIEEATKIVKAIPRTLRWRLWVIYRGSLPADRFFSTKGLYDAPDAETHARRLAEDDERKLDDPRFEEVRPLTSNTPPSNQSEVRPQSMYARLKKGKNA